MKAKLFTDGGARGNPGPAGLGAILFDMDDLVISFDAKYGGEVTNNQAEYMGLLLGLKMAAKQGVTDLAVFMDSELVIKQLNGEYKIKDGKMQDMKAKVDSQLSNFESVTFSHVKRNKNKHADKLVNLVLDAKE